MTIRIGIARSVDVNPITGTHDFSTVYVRTAPNGQEILELGESRDTVRKGGLFLHDPRLGYLYNEQGQGIAYLAPPDVREKSSALAYVPTKAFEIELKLT